MTEQTADSYNPVQWPTTISVGLEELHELRRDAIRYRRLRSLAEPHDGLFPGWTIRLPRVGETLDDSIDTY